MNIIKLILATFFTLASAVTLKQDSIAQHPKPSSLAHSQPAHPSDLQTINPTRSMRSYQPPRGMKKERKDGDGLPLLNSLVFVTWYTGPDLLNPSCFLKPIWSPSDKSHVCALTEFGWHEGRPECLSFVYLYNNVGKRLLVRIVDSCAGCTRGSHHLDLTKGVFQELIGDPKQGEGHLRMEPAPPPAKDDWNRELYGPMP